MAHQLAINERAVQAFSVLDFHLEHQTERYSSRWPALERSTWAATRRRSQLSSDKTSLADRYMRDSIKANDEGVVRARLLNHIVSMVHATFEKRIQTALSL